MILFLAITGCEPANQVKWESFSKEKMAEAAQLQKPVVAYFHAAWCPYCYKLKEKTFSDLQVIATLEPYSRLKCDMSYVRSKETMEISRQYQVQGVPTIIFFNQDGKPVKRFSGFVPPDEFLEIIRSLQPTS